MKRGKEREKSAHPSSCLVEEGRNRREAFNAKFPYAVHAKSVKIVKMMEEVEGEPQSSHSWMDWFC